MRSDFIREIFLAFAENNKDKFVTIAHEIVLEEEKKNHRLLAKDLKDIVKRISSGKNLGDNVIGRRYKDALPIPRDSDKGFPLLEIKEFDYSWEDIILGEEQENDLKSLVDEIRNAEVFRSHSLKPKQKILFCGPPGTGKTLSSQIISSMLLYPLVNIRFDSIVSSFLGETAANLKKIFSFIEQGQWVVLFDEFDIIGKHRDDPYEHGEIKRIVNNFMQMLDNYQGESLLIAATNHQQLLDSALWRRFDDVISFELPDEKFRKQIFMKYLRILKRENVLDLDSLVKKAKGFSPSDIAQVCWEALKKNILLDKKHLSTQDLYLTIEKQKRKKKYEGEGNGKPV